MRVQDWYLEAKGKHYSLELLIEFLVYEKKVLEMESSTEDLYYYMQDRFSVKMNYYLEAYDEKRTLETSEKL